MPFMSISDNIMIDEQLLQELSLKTYKPSCLHFHDSAEEENIMEWVHLELPMHEKTSITVLHNNANKESEENEENNITEKVNDSEIIINSLKSENYSIAEYNKTEYIKISLTYNSKMWKAKRTKTKEKDLKKLIHEQDLHPVAKSYAAMHLATTYTCSIHRRRKNLSRQLYYYSPTAFCRFRKAGCNLPGQ